MNEKETEYSDIIHLPHHVSAIHPQMAVSDRAAQFAPFAALTGHDAAIRETARLTDERVELDESAKEILDEKIRLVLETMAEHPQLTITYFRPDEKKSGGEYISVTGQVQKIDLYKQIILMKEGAGIPFHDLLDMEGEIFGFAEEQIL